MRPMPMLQASPPILFGEAAASEQLADARNYWVAAVRADGRPLVRPCVVYGWRSDMQNPTRWTFPPTPTP